MRAEIISCGTELLLGHISDTNATYLAQSLATLGIDLYYVSQVGDNQGRMVETLTRAWERSELIIMTGGVGPTEDDLTRESISTLLGETMSIDPDLEADLRAKFARIQMEMLESNLKQATLIPSAQPLANPIGSAPGWWVEKDGHIIVAMPGVPREMFRMWEEQVLPLLHKQTKGLIFTRILRVSGIGESAVEERLGELIHSTNPTVATYAKVGAVDVRISAKAEQRAHAQQMVAEFEVQARKRLGDAIFGVDRETLAQVVGRLLVARQYTLGIMESLTGGLLASMITDEPGSSQYFVGGIVSYATDLKARMGVPCDVLERYGAVSEQTARAMAHAARERLGTDLGVGVTGVAGPDKLEDKPVGTVYVAIEGPEGVIAKIRRVSRGERNDNKRHAALAVLDLLRKYLQGTVQLEQFS
jgi:nicotinamide-nucleotide amidase